VPFPAGAPPDVARPALAKRKLASGLAGFRQAGNGI
jgi:hypothetical protein